MAELARMNNPENTPEPSNNGKHLFIFGLGYSAGYLARNLLKKGWKISGTVRHIEEATKLQELGISLYSFDGTKCVEPFTENLLHISHILSSIPPQDGDVDLVLKHHFNDISKASHLKWVGYLSTTGVYGDRQGGWVDEASDLLPTGTRGQKRKNAEEAWFKLWHDYQIPTHSFRLAGIYGPGKNALETVKAGKARRVHKDGQVFSRIHVEDIAAILQASILSPKGGNAYNICDDNPAPPQEVISYACKLLGIDPPPLLDFETADLSPMARSFYGDNKRVSNKKIKEELGIHLKWPDYRVALKALLD